MPGVHSATPAQWAGVARYERSTPSSVVVVVAQDVQADVAVAEQQQRRALALAQAVRERPPEVVTALVDEEALLDDALLLVELHHPSPGVVVRDVSEVDVPARVGL